LEPDRVVIAEILRSRGNRGEVLAVSQTDVPGRLEALKRTHVRLADGSDITVEIENAWRHGEHWVLKFAGCDSIADAERFRGADVWVSREERGSLPEGEYFRSDLMGCSVQDAATGEEIGTVEGFEQYGGPLLLAVSVSGREVLIPFVPEICRKVDVERKTIAVMLPEGLLEL
jgi:16S rRNA processing protein RimM